MESQLPLFPELAAPYPPPDKDEAMDPVTPPVNSEVTVDPDLVALTERIAEVAKVRFAADEPDSTDRWLKDTGGGERRETLAADPPVPRKKRVNTRPIESPYTDMGSDVRDSDPSRRPIKEVLATTVNREDPEVAAAKAERQRLLARHVGVPYTARKIDELADGDPRQAMILSALYAERPRH